ncbi:MAG: hypothetical protein IT374_24565 [Polyangiaceae bacterium]|nr:hypothetical protein [Polyangiaceae bacterium]
MKTFARLALAMSVVSVLGSSALGCDDPVPPVRKGAVRFELGTVTPALKDDKGNTINCTWNGSELKMGIVDGNGHTPVDEEQGDYRVNCRVAADGTFAASLSGPRTSTTQLSFDIQGKAVQGGDAQGVTVSFADSQFGPYQSNPTASCTVSLSTAGGDNALAVAAGRIWGRFSCPRLSIVDQTDTSSCSVLAGYFVFENCDE